MHRRWRASIAYVAASTMEGGRSVNHTRRNMARTAAAAAIICGFASAGEADVNLGHVVTFGDSLTDNQSILPRYTGLPPTLYGHDPMQLVFDKNGLPGNELSDYAVAGFTSSNVGLQIDLYQFNIFFGFEQRATLFQLEMGGNDILNNDSLLYNNAPGTNGSADRVITDLIRNWKTYAQDLASTARPDARAVVWTLPDITLTPRYWQTLSPTQEANLRAHTQRANRFIRTLGRFDNVAVLDLWTILAEMIADPPRLGEVQLLGPPHHGETTHLFADEIHPTAVSNALLANEIIALMNQKWDAGFEFYSEGELIDFALNGGWRIPSPGSAAAVLIGACFIAPARRRRAA